MKKFFGELKRYDNPMFWITGISQLLVVIQFVLAIFGKEQVLDQTLQNKIMQAVNVIVVFLGTIGVFTKGASKLPIDPVVPIEPIPPAEPVVAPVVPSEPVAPAEPVKDEPSVVVPSEEPTKQAESSEPAPSIVQGPTIVVDESVTPEPIAPENK